MASLVSAAKFAAFLIARWTAHDGYIMGATGQNPRTWSTGSWWFTQYKNKTDRAKALYWRANAPRVWDCQGLADGYYQDQTGVNVNTRARNNYASWCGVKGTGTIPVSRRVPGAAVFHHNGLYIHHVGFLVEPVTAGKPEGDWYVIEARGVRYGVVRTNLSDKGRWNRWGWMTKYFDYTQPVIETPPVVPETPAPADPAAMVYPVRGIIPDVSSCQGAIQNFNAFCNCTDFAIFRVIRSNGEVDTQAKRNMSECKQRGYPFGVYVFFKAFTEATARAQVRNLVETSAPYAPRFYVLDVEAWYPMAAVRAAIDEARKLGITKLGIYMGSYRWRTRYKVLAGLFDFVWLANYGRNTGYVDNIPDSPCDLHQYTSVATVPGISDKTCDRSRLTGNKPLSFFTGRQHSGVEYPGIVRATGIANVRTGPSTTYGKIGVTEKGRPYERRGVDQAGYTPIWYKGKQGWVSAKYVQEVSEK